MGSQGQMKLDAMGFGRPYSWPNPVAEGLAPESCSVASVLRRQDASPREGSGGRLHCGQGASRHYIFLSDVPTESISPCFFFILRVYSTVVGLGVNILILRDHPTPLLGVEPFLTCTKFVFSMTFGWQLERDASPWQGLNLCSHGHGIDGLVIDGLPWFTY